MVGIDPFFGMTEVIRVDSKGRLLLPKSVREKTEIKEGTYVKVETQGTRVILESTETPAEKYRGIFKTESIPEDLDNYLEGEILKKWLKKHT